LQKITFEESQRALAGKIYAATFAVGDDAFVLGGATQPRDLDTQLSVLAAYVADPGFRPEAFERLRSAYLTALPQLAATPEGVVNRDLGGLLHSEDPRWMFPTEASLQAATPDAPKSVLGPSLSGGPIEIAIVGDIDPDKAIDLVSKTFGALPARPPAWKSDGADKPVHFPSPTSTPVTRADTGRPDQAEAIVAWPTTDFFANMKRSRAGMLAGEVLQNRILDEVRISQGATYSPETQASFSETTPGYGAAISEVEMPPTKIPGYFDTVTRLTQDLRDKGLTEDELARARNPRVSGIEKAQLTNEYWLERLSGAIADPRRLDLIRTTLPDYQAMTTADVQAAAKAYFVDAKAWRMVISAQK
jgi:zinc protease